MFDLRIELKKVALKVQEILETIKSIKEALYDSGWIEYAEDIQTVKYCKKNGFVTLWIYNNPTGINAKTWTTVFTLPEGFRPTMDIRIASDTSSGDLFCTARVLTNGDVQIYLSIYQRYFNISGTFPVGGGYFLTLLRRLLRGGVCYA